MGHSWAIQQSFWCSWVRIDNFRLYEHSAQIHPVCYKNFLPCPPTRLGAFPYGRRHIWNFSQSFFPWRRIVPSFLIVVALQQQSQQNGRKARKQIWRYLVIQSSILGNNLIWAIQLIPYTYPDLDMLLMIPQSALVQLRFLFLSVVVFPWSWRASIPAAEFNYRTRVVPSRVHVWLTTDRIPSKLELMLPNCCKHLQRILPPRVFFFFFFFRFPCVSFAQASSTCFPAKESLKSILKPGEMMSNGCFLKWYPKTQNENF